MVPSERCSGRFLCVTHGTFPAPLGSRLSLLLLERTRADVQGFRGLDVPAADSGGGRSSSTSRCVSLLSLPSQPAAPVKVEEYDNTNDEQARVRHESSHKRNHVCEALNYELGDGHCTTASGGARRTKSTVRRKDDIHLLHTMDTT